MRHLKERPRIYAWDIAAGAAGGTIAVVVAATAGTSILGVLLALLAGSWIGPALARVALGPSLPDSDKNRLVRAIVTGLGFGVGVLIGQVVWPLSAASADPQEALYFARWVVLLVATGSSTRVLLAATQRLPGPAPASPAA